MGKCQIGGRVLTDLCGGTAVLFPMQQQAVLGLVQAAWEAAALELLTRLSATQQLRAINPALEVPWIITTRRRSHSPAFPLRLWALTPSAFLAVQIFEYHQSMRERERESVRDEY